MSSSIAANSGRTSPQARSTGMKVWLNRRSRRMEASTIKSFKDINFTLYNGLPMQSVGLGTYRMKNEEQIRTVVDAALAEGYRLFDTAAVYNNEGLLSKVFEELLPKYGLERKDIFITTKLCKNFVCSPHLHGTIEIVREAYNRSLRNLGFSYVDLYLIHFPGTAGMDLTDVRNREMRLKTWAAMEELYDSGEVHAIGVSNFTVRHLQEIEENYSMMPMVNQVEWHPFYYQPELQSYCREKEITLQAYCSFGGTSSGDRELIDNPVVMKIAKKLGVTCAQLLLMWALQQDVAVIPKSNTPERLKENITLNFRIPEKDMKQLNELGDKKKKYAWDPKNVY